PRHPHAGRFTNTGAIHIDPLAVGKRLLRLIERIGIESSGASNAKGFRVEIAVAANIVDPGPARQLVRRVARQREGNGASRALLDQHPTWKAEIAADQRDDDYPDDPAESMVAARDSLQRAAKCEAEPEVRNDIECGTRQIEREEWPEPHVHGPCQ